MPIESVLIGPVPPPLARCPNCGAEPFDPFLRGMVSRPRRRWWIFGRRRPPWALICRVCKEIVDYEEIPVALTPAVVAEYANAVGRRGPASEEAAAVREKYRDVPGFSGFADALDRIKRALSGSDIDYPPNP